MPPISVLMKPASGMCNMSCEYCFYCDETKKRERESYGFMSEETLKNVIRKTILKAEGAAGYAFQGGEPTLRGLDFFEKVIYYQKKYNKNNVKVSNALQTNGICIDENWCRFLKENQFLVGLSVDGTKETHDSYRHDKNGNGTYDRILRAAERMEEYRVDYNILTVIHHDVAYNIEKIYRDYKKRGWNYQQYIVCMDPLGELHGLTPYAIKPEVYGEFLIQLFDLWYADLQKGEQPYIRQFENYISILLGYRAEACDQNGRCGIQNVVEADGSVYPCDFYMMDEYRLGNFNTDTMEQINQKRSSIGFIERSLQLNEKCTVCKYFKICRGGCQRNRDFNESSMRYENYFCESYYLFFEACYEKFKTIVDKIRINSKFG